MPNQQRGHVVGSRADYAQQQLDQYTKTKEQISSIDQERSEGPGHARPGRHPASWKHALSNPALEKQESESLYSSVDKADVWKATGRDSGLEKDYSHLSVEQQEQYADLQSRIVPDAPSKDQEIEL